MRVIDNINCYEAHDLCRDGEDGAAIAEARRMSKRDAKLFSEVGGAEVQLGSGVCAWFVSMAGTPERRILVHPPLRDTVAGSYKATRKAQAFLDARGIECHWRER